MRYVAASLLVVALGCRPGADQVPAGGKPVPPTAQLAEGARASAPNNDSGLLVAFEGLVGFAQRTAADGRPVLWALMPDARDPVSLPPDCSNLGGTYPKHEPVVYVQDGSIWEHDRLLPDHYVSIAEYDVRIQTGVAGMGAVDLDALVTGQEVTDTSAHQPAPGPAALGAVDERYLDPAPGTVANEPALVARILVDAADSIKARANLCYEKDPSSYDPQLYSFNQAEGGSCQASPESSGVPFAEQVLVTQAGVTEVKLVLSNADSKETRTLTIKRDDGTLKPLKIAFRNVMNDLDPVHGKLHDARGLKWEDCDTMMPDHYAAYRWFFLLAENRDPSRCSWIPCEVVGDGGSGGKRCPEPGYEP